MSGSSWLKTKNHSKAVLADLDQFWPGSDRPKSRPSGPRWRQVAAKMAPRCSEDVYKTPRDGLMLETPLGLCSERASAAIRMDVVSC